MVISLYLQAKLVIFSILAGVLTGFLFDLYRTFRGLENIPKVFIIVEDILFWVLTTIVVFTFLLYTNYAFVGAYVYIYIAIGIYAYMRLVSRTITTVQLKLINTITKFIRIFINFAFYPIKLIIYSFNSKNKKFFSKK